MTKYRFTFPSSVPDFGPMTYVATGLLSVDKADDALLFKFERIEREDGSQWDSQYMAMSPSAHPGATLRIEQ